LSKNQLCAVNFKGNFCDAASFPAKNRLRDLFTKVFVAKKKLKKEEDFQESK